MKSRIRRRLIGQRAILEKRYGLQWSGLPLVEGTCTNQQMALDSLLGGAVEAAELLGPYAAAARHHPDERLLYDTSLEWHALTGTWPMHHVLATYADVLEEHPELPAKLVDALRASGAYARLHVPELIDEYVETVGGDPASLDRWGNEGDTIGQRYVWSLDAEDRRAIQIYLDLSADFGFASRRYAAEEVTFEPG